MKRTLKAATYTAGVLASLAVLLPLLFEKQIGDRALAALRDQLATELEVGGVSLSLWRDFPYASVRLQQVRLAGAADAAFISAGYLAGRISYYDLLFADELTIQTVELADADISVHRDAQGGPNWLILKPNVDSTATAEFGFAIRKVLLDDVDVRYVDEHGEVDGDWHVDEGELQGRFGTSAYTLRGNVTGLSRYLEIGARRYLPEFELAAVLELDIDPQANVYTFGPSSVQLDGMPVDVRGSIGFVAEGTDYDLQLATDDGRLGPLLRALPTEWVTPGMRAMDTKGAFSLGGSIVGVLGAEHVPAIDFTGQLRGGSLEVPSLDRSADEVSFDLSYTNGEERSMRASRLTLTNLAARLDGQDLTGAFVWKDFADPYFDITATGTLPLAWLDALWPEGGMSGELRGTKARISGRQRHLAETKFAGEVTAEGDFALHRAEVSYLGERFAVEAHDIGLNGVDLEIGGASLIGLGNEFAGDITLDGLVPYLFGDGTQILSIGGQVTSPEVNLKRWVDLFSQGSAESAEGDSRNEEHPLATTLAADFSLGADAFTYGKVHGKRFSGSGKLEDSKLRIWGEALGMEGYWEVDGEAELSTTPRLSAKLACSEVSVHELFEQSDNLGQDVLQARHIQGEMTARSYVEAAWDQSGRLITDDLHVWANVGLNDGELRDLEMLQALSMFVRSDDLKDILFTDTENWIEVERGRVYLPAMFIQTTATNFVVSGAHSFDNRIDYAVRLNGAQVAMTKLFGKRPGTDFLPDRRNGWAKVSLKIEGTLDDEDYDVRLSGGAVKRNLASSLSRKRAIRNRLTGLFGEGSLIDDYDDVGERRHAAALAPDRASLPEPRRESTPTHGPSDRESTEYIDWDHAPDAATEAVVDKPVRGNTAVLSAPRPAVEPAPSGGDDSPAPRRSAPLAEPSPTPATAPKPVLSQPSEAAEEGYDPNDPAEDYGDEYLDGFDDPPR